MGNVIDMQFLPIKLPPVYGPPLFYKSTHIALDENHRGNCSGLMVPTSKILGIGSPPIKCLFSKNNVKTYLIISDWNPQNSLLFYWKLAS